MITLATVKTLLGISTTTYDTQIAFWIPLVESDVRRIINHKFNEKVSCTFESGATTISGIGSYHYDNPIEIGRIVYHENLADGTYITAYDDETGIATISEASTGVGEYVRTSILIAQWQAIARMIWFRISKATTGTAVDATVTSKSMGDVSVSFDVTHMNKAYGYPQSIIDDLGTPYQRVG